MSGASPITHEEISAWSEGYGYEITSFERRCLRAIDNEYRRSLVKD